MSERRGPEPDLAGGFGEPAGAARGSMRVAPAIFRAPARGADAAWPLARAAFAGAPANVAPLHSVH